MNETIKKMREYLQLKDDWYISKQLDILEKQIQLEITKAELKTVNRIKQIYKQIKLKKMKNTVENELKNYLLDCINDGILTNDNIDDWHYYAFNEDYYISYHSEGFRWLKNTILTDLQLLTKSETTK